MLQEPITKTCTGPCKKVLTLDRFDSLKTGKYGKHPCCKDCRSLQRKALNYKKRTEGTKQCLGCNIDKPVTEYHGDRMASDGLQSRCKACKEKQTITWGSTFDGFVIHLYKDIRDGVKKRAKNLEVTITTNDIKRLYNKQKGKCILTGLKMTHTLDKSTKGTQYIFHKYNMSVDRIDSNKSYTKDNIQLVCAIVNRIKFDLDMDEFLLFCDDIAKSN